MRTALARGPISIQGREDDIFSLLSLLTLGDRAYYYSMGIASTKSK